eukprot:s5130_g3.t1
MNLSLGGVVLEASGLERSVKGRNSSSTDPPSDEKLRGGSPRSPKKGSPSRVSAGTARNKAPPMALRQHQPTHPEARTGKVFASLGSVFHDEGRCQPCRFVSLPDGCRNGAECTFCHNESHETDPNSAHRPPKGVRSGYKKSVNQVMESDLPDEQKREALKRLATKSPYLRALVRKALPDLVAGRPRACLRAEGQGCRGCSPQGPSSHYEPMQWRSLKLCTAVLARISRNLASVRACPDLPPKP